ESLAEGLAGGYQPEIVCRCARTAVRTRRRNHAIGLSEQGQAVPQLIVVQENRWLHWMGPPHVFGQRGLDVPSRPSENVRCPLRARCTSRLQMQPEGG